MDGETGWRVDALSPLASPSLAIYKLLIVKRIQCVLVQYITVVIGM